MHFGAKLRLFIFMIALFIVSIICLIIDSELSDDYTEEEVTTQESEDNTDTVIETRPNEEAQAIKPPVKEDKLSSDWGDDDAELLVRIAMAEAGNQSTIGKALVIRVILNRVQDESFPNTIREVIYQKHQFSPIANGSFDRVVPTEDCWKALEMVSQGWDESQGALYFESFKNDDNWHSRNLQFLFKYQDHKFYKHK